MTTFKDNQDELLERIADVEKKLVLQPFFNMLKEYTEDGKMITDTELNTIAEEYGLIT